MLQRPPVGEYGPAENQLGSGWNAPESPNSPRLHQALLRSLRRPGWRRAAARPTTTVATTATACPTTSRRSSGLSRSRTRRRTSKLGWRKPQGDGNKGGNSKIDVYLSQIGNVGLFGYANTDPGESQRQQRYAYLVLDNDYKEFAPLTPLKALQVTVAHEYNHILQFGIDYNQQIWMFEASATWMEEQVYPAVSDWLRYVPAFAASTAEPLTRALGRPGPEDLRRRRLPALSSPRAPGLGPDVVRDAWVKLAEGQAEAFRQRRVRRLDPQEQGLEASRKEFSKFAAATAEWNAGNDFPDAEAPALTSSGPASSRVGRLEDVQARPPRLRALQRQARATAASSSSASGAEKGTQSAIALVGRKGSRRRARARPT